MTPLAHAIAKELTLPKAHRTFSDYEKVLSKIEDVHCFEVTGIVDLANALAHELIMDEAPLISFGGLAFLPAPKTWIEFVGVGGRQGYLLTQSESNKCRAKLDVSVESEFGAAHMANIPLDGHPDLARGYDLDLEIRSQGDENTYGEVFGAIFFIYALISLINSPRRINQKVIMPHAGLQRKLAAAHGGVGKYPLQAYRELTLKVAPPVDATDKDAWIDYLDNRRPLHFVRAHRRRSSGVNDPRYDRNDYSTWDLIPAAWRGDPALGIKLTRYKLVV